MTLGFKVGALEIFLCGFGVGGFLRGGLAFGDLLGHQGCEVHVGGSTLREQSGPSLAAKYFRSGSLVIRLSVCGAHSALGSR